MSKDTLYLLPRELKYKVEKKQIDKDKWVNIYWHGKRRKHTVYPKIKKYDNYDEKFINSGQAFNKDTLYKDYDMSKRSKYFNYYRILKKNVKAGRYFENDGTKPKEENSKPEIKSKEELYKTKLLVKF